MSLPDAHSQTILEALSYWAETTPDAIALLSPGREPTTYRELHGAVDRLASDLRACGLGRQDGIALLLPEGPELCLALLAAMSAGVAFPLAWPAPATEYRQILASPRLRAIVISAEVESSRHDLARTGLPMIGLSAGASGRIEDVRVDTQRRGDPAPRTAPDEDDIALILHSSGTTGRPKVIPRTKRNIVATCRVMIEMRALTPADRCLSLARTAHSQGFVTLTTTILAGASLISIPGPDLDALPQWLREFRPTYLSTTPAILRTLGANRGDLRAAFQRSPLRCIHSTAGPLLSDELQRIEAIIGAPILNTYGSTEVTCIAGEQYSGFHRVPGSVGPVWCDVRITGTSGEHVGPGETGEIVVRGDRVFPGYLDDPEANAAAFLPDGWFRTGDVGFVDEAGFLHLTGRLSELINRGGEKIAPVEVDRVLLAHPAVAEAAVFAVPDARLGEDIVAAVVAKPGSGASPLELRWWMLDRLSPFKVPRRIWMVDDLPRTRTGKVQRGVLADRFLSATRPLSARPLE